MVTKPFCGEVAPWKRRALADRPRLRLQHRRPPQGLSSGRLLRPVDQPGSEIKKKGEYLTERLTEESIRFLEKRNKKKPFLLYLSYYNIHTPIQPYKKRIDHYVTKAKKTFEETRPPDRSMKARPACARTTRPSPRWSPRWMTASGALTAKLDQLGLTENTVIIFFSDNGGLSTLRGPGPGSNLPLRAGKGWLYEGGVREPTIVRAPGVTKPGSVCDDPVVSMDFFPTMLELAGLPLKPKLHADAIDGEGQKDQRFPKSASRTDREKGKPRPLYWHYPHYHGSTWKPGSSIRDGDWKLIKFYHYDKVELYDLAKDPSETNDLAKKHPDKAKELESKLVVWQTEMNAKLPVPNPDYSPPSKKNK